MKIGKIEIKRASDIKLALDKKKPESLKDKAFFCYTLGLYNSRIFGLCIYRYRDFKHDNLKL